MSGGKAAFYLPLLNEELARSFQDLSKFRFSDFSE